MKWAIIADSSCNIREFEPTAPSTIYRLAPLKISVGDQEFIDDASLDVAAMNRTAAESEEASSSSCPNAGEWADLFRQADNVIAIAISSNLSASYETALMGRNIVMDEYAREHDGVISGKNIFVLDSKAAGGKLDLMVELLDRFIATQDPSFEEAVRYLKLVEGASNVLYSLSSYGNLVKSGRMPKLVGKVASGLKIRVLGKASPQGTIKIVGTTRGEKGTVKRIVETMAEFGYNGGLAYINDVDNPKGAEKVEAGILAKWPRAVVRRIPCGGLCSYYAEESGLIIGFEWLTA